MTRFKGKALPSWTDPQSGKGTSGQAGPHRALAEGKQYIGFTGTKARFRYLKQQCREIINSQNPQVIVQIKRVKEHVESLPTEKEREFAMYFIMNSAKRKADDAQVSWVEVMEYDLDKYEEQARVTLEKMIEEQKNVSGREDRGVSGTPTEEVVNGTDQPASS